MMTRLILKALAWLSLAAILFATISPIGLRPTTITTVNFDRAAAYAVLAAIFVVAYPRQWKLVALLLVGGAMAIETLQYLSPTRHPHLADAAVKGAGAAAGTVAGWAWNEFVRLPALARMRASGDGDRPLS